MRRKLHRRKRRQMFGRRRHPIGKIFGRILLLVVAGLAGFATVSLIRSAPSAPADSAPESSTLPTQTTAAATTEATAPDTPKSAADLRAAYCQTAALRDAAARTEALAALRQQGYTAVIFDLKTADGILHYAFSGPFAAKARTVAEDAMTADELSALLADCAANNLTAIPRLYAFEDSSAPKRLKSARINWSDDKSTMWLDAKAANGGKSWLNPYSADARAYLIELASALRDADVTAVLFDGVCFPSSTYQAYFGTDAETAEGYAGALTAFVTECSAALGDKTELLLCAPLAATLGTDTAVYGGNPLTFGADVVCPRIDAASLTAFAGSPTGADSPAVTPTVPKELLSRSLAAVTTRLDFVKGQKPRLLPHITSDLADALPGGSACIVEAR